VQPTIRKLRFHDARGCSIKRDGMVLFYSPSFKPTAFHKWLNELWLTDANVRARGTRLLKFRAELGHYYDIFAPAVHGMTHVSVAEGAPSEISVEVLDGQMIPEEVEVAPGEVRVRVQNRLAMMTSVGIGDLGTDNSEHPEPLFELDRFLSGKQLLTTQTFRELFRTETIAPGEGLELKGLSILFTDLQASTAMYERVGDLHALELVRKHFEILNDVIARERGAVVKTIGDAVMASFAEPDRAVSAALRMNESVRRAGLDLILKIGLHAGPCVAIQSNNQIDYFGRTVNIAARVQGIADGGEIVLTDAVWQHPRVPQLVERAGQRVRVDRVQLKGIADDVEVRRLAQ
jgi:class 3 adenylate cyclase